MEKENVKNIEVQEEVLALKYLAVVFDREPAVVAAVMQAMVDDVRDNLIESLISENTTEEQLTEARNLFYAVELKLADDLSTKEAE